MGIGLPFIFAYGLFAKPRTALAGLYWFVTRRRVRGRNLMLNAAMEHRAYYRLWTAVSEPRILDDFAATLVDPPQQTPPQPTLPIITILLDCAAASAHEIHKTLASVRRELGPDAWVYCDHPETTAKDTACKALPTDLAVTVADVRAETGGDAWLLPVRAGDLLARSAGSILRAGAQTNEAISVIYWDEDKLEGGRRSTPFLKPDWDELYYLARDLVSGAGMMRLSAAQRALDCIDDCSSTPHGFAEIFLSIIVNEMQTAPLHIPMLLVHRRPGTNFASPAQRKAMIARHWRENLEISLDGPVSDALSIRFPLPSQPPTISIIIPTRDRVELLQTCMTGIAKVQYPGNLEVIIVDNDSSDRETLDYLSLCEREGHKVIRHAGPFNFSAMNNRAAREAADGLLCLLNNDIEMIENDWLTIMAGHACRPGIGAVGALLLYPDETVQHAGVAVGVGGAAGHVHRGMSLDSTDTVAAHRVTRRVTAVTAACLLVPKDAFWAIGGLDAEAFKVAFNDVDLCLKLDRAGFSNVYVAEAKLIHHESKSRGNDMSEENFDRYSGELKALQDRWSTPTFVDPFHHPLWLRSSERCALTP